MRRRGILRPSKATAAARRHAAGAVLVCALLASACGEAAITADPGTQSAASAAASSSPLGQAPSAQGLAVHDLDGATLYGVAEAGATTVAVGAAAGAAAAWTSAAAASWQPAGVRDAADVPQLRAVAFAQDRGIAFGGDDLAVSKVWTSSDGTDWAVAADAQGIDGRINAVAIDGATWIAVGERVDPESGESAGGRVWTSQDGKTWQTAAELPTGEGTISDVAVTAGSVVVVGFDVRGGRVWTGAVDDLQSVSGRELDAVTLQGVAATADGFVAVGQTVGDLRPLVWSSRDGSEWQRTKLDPATFPPVAEIHDLAASAEGLIAVGATPAGGIVWTSDDGVAWRGVATADGS